MSDLFSRHGVEHVISVAQEEVEWFFEDAEEIGSSDVSICVRAVYDKLNEHPDKAPREEIQEVRSLIHSLIHSLPRNQYA